jgi:hypothetical protein
VVDAPLDAVRDVVAEAAEVAGAQFRMPKVGPKTLFLSGQIEGTLASAGDASLVVWKYRHHIVEYLAVVFLSGAVALGVVLGIAGLFVAQSYALGVIAYTLVNVLMLGVVLQLMHDERSKLRGDLEKTLGRAGRWTMTPRTRGAGIE